jgi:hypothetical protein
MMNTSLIKVGNLTKIFTGLTVNALFISTRLQSGTPESGAFVLQHVYVQIRGSSRYVILSLYEYTSITLALFTGGYCV